MSDEGIRRYEERPGLFHGFRGIYAHLDPVTDTEERAVMTNPQKSNRRRLLEEATELVDGDRNQDYGPPIEDFTRNVGQLNALGYRGPGCTCGNARLLVPHDWPIMIIAGKQSRNMVSPEKQDNWTDTAGYSACGWDTVCEEIKRGEEGSVG